MGKSWKILYNWVVFHCHVWLPDGSSEEAYLMLGITASRFRSDSFRQFASPWACHMAIWSYTSRGASLTSSRRPRCSPSQAANSVWDISVSFSLSLSLSLSLSPSRLHLFISVLLVHLHGNVSCTFPVLHHIQFVVLVSACLKWFNATRWP